MKHRVCIDRILPQNIMRPFRLVETVAFTRAVAPLGKQWINGSTLRVRFMGGTPEQIAAVAREARVWEDACNLKFDFNNAPDAEIRITFDPHDGAWSYVGTDCKFIPLDQPTMNLGWIDGGVIAHEFGHAIGLGHEHQNPSGGIQWNEPEVISDLSGSPNFWDEATIRHNVLRKYSLDQIRGSQFDAYSIMLYEFPASWTRNGVSTRSNSVPSKGDKDFAAKVMYPFPEAPVTPDEPVKKSVTLSTSAWFRSRAFIQAPGEEDLYDFVAERPGLYTVNTAGTSDMVMRLYGPNKQTLLIAEDDNSGVRKNAQIARELPMGQYWVQVRHADTSRGVGSYTIKVTHHR